MITFRLQVIIEQMGDGLLVGIGLVRFNVLICAAEPIENGRFLLLYLTSFGDELLGGGITALIL